VAAQRQTAAEQKAVDDALNSGAGLSDDMMMVLSTVQMAKDCLSHAQR
jgi:hypothetical protein